MSDDHEPHLSDWMAGAHDVFHHFHGKVVPHRSADTHPVFVDGRYVGNVQRMTKLWLAFGRDGSLHSHGHGDLQSAIDALEATA